MASRCAGGRSHVRRAICSRPVALSLCPEGVATKVGIYRMLGWMLFSDRCTDLSSLFRYLGSLMFYHLSESVAYMYVVGAPLASTP